jgi:hypothetical protein
MSDKAPVIILGFFPLRECSVVTKILYGECLTPSDHQTVFTDSDDLVAVVFNTSFLIICILGTKSTINNMFLEGLIVYVHFARYMY